VVSSIMNCLIILGTGRMGKSTLARIVAKKHGCNVVHLDCLVDAFEHTMPEVGIAHNPRIGNAKLQTNKNAKDAFAKFLVDYVDCMLEYGNLVVEGSYLSVQSVVEYFNIERFRIVVLGTPALNTEQSFNAMRHHDTEDEWTYYCNDKTLLERAQRNIERSKQLFNQAQSLGVQTLDTSDARNKIFRVFAKSLSFNKYKGASEKRKSGLKNYVENVIN